MSITFSKPSTLRELLEAIDKTEKEFHLLAGGTDINIELKSGVIRCGNIFYIKHLDELRGIEKNNGTIRIGTAVTVDELRHDALIDYHFPFLQESLMTFASPLIQSTATIGGNIANGSPTNDVSPPLLVLDAELELQSITGTRIIPLSNFYKGYKQFEMKSNEIITAVILSTNAQTGFTTFYRKVAARNALAIAKLSLAGLKKGNNKRIEVIKLAAGSLNEYPRRLIRLEEYLTGREQSDVTRKEIESILRQDVAPISDLRSDKDYRFGVCLNLVMEFVEG